MSLSAIVLTKNSERCLKACLGSLTFADELLVIDDHSTDTTIKIAQMSGAKIIVHSMNGDFSAQRRFAVEQASGEWLLFIDSDEVVSPELAEEIKSVIQKEYCACELLRENRFLHHSIRNGSMRGDRVLRLFPREGLSIVGRVHEKMSSKYPVIRLSGILFHYPYEDWSAMIRKLDAYTSYLAQQQIEKKKNTCFLIGALLKPTWAFLKVYVFHRGFLDGRMGLMFAVHHAYYTFMKYAKFNLLQDSQGKF